MNNLVLSLLGVDMEHYPQAHREAARHGHVMRARECDVVPAKRYSGGDGGEFCVEVRRCAEEGAGYLVGVELVELNDLFEQLGRGV